MRETLRFIRGHLAPHRRAVARLSALAIIASAADAAVPILYGRALDTLIARSPWTTLAILLGSWFVLDLVKNELRQWISFRGSAIADRIARDVDVQSLHHALALPLAYHITEGSAAISDRIQNVRNHLERVLTHGLFSLAPGLLTLIAATAYLFVLHPILGCANVVIIAVSFALSVRLASPIDRAGDVSTHAHRELYVRMWDCLRNAALVKVNNGERHEIEKIRTLAETARAAEVERETIHRRHGRTQDLTFGIGTIALFATVAALVHRDTLTVGSIAVVLGYGSIAWSMVGQFLWIWWDAMALHAHRKEYDAFARVAEEPYDRGRDLRIRGAVTFDHVRFQYREDTPVLDDVSFTIAAGEVVAIVGESGQGKSTIVDLLARLYIPQSGTIAIDGVPAEEIALDSLRGQLAHVPQDLSLRHDSICENIRHGRPEASDGEVEIAATDAAIHEWITSLPDGYDTVVGERGLKLSAGQRQRVALSRAFLRKPRILILDEPTSNLDAATEACIQERLRTLMRGRTTIIIAHRLRTVQDADRILVLRDGRIAEHGAHAELLLRNGEYRRLHRLQFADAHAEAA